MKSSSIFCVALLLTVAICFGCTGKAPKPVELKPGGVEMAADPTPAETEIGAITRMGGNIAHVSDIHFNPFYDKSLCPQLIAKEATEWEAIFKTSKITGYGEVNSSETNFNLFTGLLTGKPCQNVQSA